VLSITAKMVSARDGYLFWSGRFEGRLAEALSVQQEVAAAINVQLGAGHRGRPAIALPAHVQNTYLRARHFAGQATIQGCKHAITYYRLTLQDAPNYAPAHAGLAWCVLNLTAMGAQPHDYMTADGSASGVLPPKAIVRTAVDAALKADASLALGYVVQARLLAELEQNPAEAEAAFRRAIQLMPSSSYTHERFGTFFSRLGRHTESIPMLRRALALDPLSASAHGALTQGLYYAGRLDEALQLARTELQMFPTEWGVWFDFGRIQMARGASEEGIAAFVRAKELAGKPPSLNVLASLAHAYGVAGNLASAQSIVAELHDEQGRRSVSPMVMALAYLPIDNVRARVAIERAISEHDHRLHWLHLDPRFSALRSDPQLRPVSVPVGLQDGSERHKNPTGTQRDLREPLPALPTSATLANEITISCADWWTPDGGSEEMSRYHRKTVRKTVRTMEFIPGYGYRWDDGSRVYEEDQLQPDGLPIGSSDSGILGYGPARVVSPVSVQDRSRRREIPRLSAIPRVGSLTPVPPGDFASSPEVTYCSSLPCRPQSP
jgi:tetratricopeptide (TPR) repeat protein